MSSALLAVLPEPVRQLIVQVEKLECCGEDVAIGMVMKWAASAALQEMLINRKREERFLRLIDKTPGYGPNGDCWLWLGRVDTGGYARFKVRYRYIPVHRKMYVDLRGPIPEGLVCDHLCRVRNCVNPFHLDLVTSVVNTRRGKSGEYQKAKTHCPQGHEYTPDNVYMRKTSRHCKACLKVADKKRKETLKKLREERNYERRRTSVSLQSSIDAIKQPAPH